MPSNPTDATEVERSPRSAPSVAQPPATTRAGGNEVDGTVRRGAAPSTPTASGPAHGQAGPLVITVIGKPAPQGSKRHVGNGRMIESSKRVKPWREAVKEAARDALELLASQTYGDPSAAALLRLDGPVQVEAAFCFDPPKSAPKLRRIWPITRSSGDLDKNLRAIFDALTEAGAFRDDSQIVTVLARKCHTTDADAPLRIPGAVIAITEVTP